MIQTKRCLLNDIKPTDLEYVIRLYTDQDVRRFLGGPVDVDTARTTFERWAASDSSIDHWAIRTSDQNIFIGYVSLGQHHDGEEIEVSYMLLPEWWGKGFGGEAVRAVINFAFSEYGLQQVIAETQTANIASCKMLERIGLLPVKTLIRFGAQQSIYSIRR